MDFSDARNTFSYFEVQCTHAKYLTVPTQNTFLFTNDNKTSLSVCMQVALSRYRLLRLLCVCSSFGTYLGAKHKCMKRWAKTCAAYTT